MFLEKRVYQGSSGKVYPLPFTDRIAENARSTGSGRPSGWKTSFCGSWCCRKSAGGSTPSRTRPTATISSTARRSSSRRWSAWPGRGFPAASSSTGRSTIGPRRSCRSIFDVEEHADGSKTVWCSDHDPMARMKGMHGVCLHPGRALLELKVRAYNRTPFVQTFLWWANVATRVHEAYQSFFPPDVYYVADHARRSMSEYPLCSGLLLRRELWRARTRRRARRAKRPRQFVPPHCRKPGLELRRRAPDYAPNDLSWYANIPVPTSYMCMGSQEDFFGGYDTRPQAGIVHVANHHISPGKKQWTWGNHEFGYAWDRNLTEPTPGDGPTSKSWPASIPTTSPTSPSSSPAKRRPGASTGIRSRRSGPRSTPTSKRRSRSELSAPAAGRRPHRRGRDRRRFQRPRSRSRPAANRRSPVSRATLPPASRSFESHQLPPRASVKPTCCSASPMRRPRDHLLSARSRASQRRSPAARHRTARARGRSPAPTNCSSPACTWSNIATPRAARRSTGARRCAATRSMPLQQRAGPLASPPRRVRPAETHFRKAIERLTRRKPNPYDGEPYYNLGLCLRHRSMRPGRQRRLRRLLQGDLEPGLGRRRAITPWPRWTAAGAIGPRPWSTRPLAAASIPRTCAPRTSEGDRAAQARRKSPRPRRFSSETLALDPLDWWARHLLGEAARVRRSDAPRPRASIWPAPGSTPRRSNCCEHGLQTAPVDERRTDPTQSLGAAPLVHYYARLAACKARRPQSRARRVSSGRRRAARLLLPRAAGGNRHPRSRHAPRTRSDARAPYYLGNLLYDRRRHDEAIRLWERSAQTRSDLLRRLAQPRHRLFQHPPQARQGPRCLRQGLPRRIPPTPGCSSSATSSGSGSARNPRSACASWKSNSTSSASATI